MERTPKTKLLGAVLSCLVMFVLLVACTKAQGAEAESLPEQIAEKSGLTEAMDSLARGTKALLNQWGADNLGEEGLDGGRIFQALCALVQEKLTGPLKAWGAVLGVLLLCRLAGCMEEGSLSPMVPLIGCLACAAITLPAILALLAQCAVTAESASAFLLASMPAYGALLAASGSVAAGSAYTFLTLGAGSALPLLSSGLLLPLLRIYLALAVSSGVSGMPVQRLSASLYSFIKWMLVLAVTLFSGILSIQTILNTHIDAAAGKTVKLIASSAIPIVGGALGDAVGAIQSSVQVVRSGAGAFGMLAALCIFAPAMIEASIWAGVCTLGQIAGELFGVPAAAGLLGSCASAAKLVLAVLASLCVVCLTCAGVVLFAKGG